MLDQSGLVSAIYGVGILHSAVCTPAELQIRTSLACWGTNRHHAACSSVLTATECSSSAKTGTSLLVYPHSILQHLKLATLCCCSLQPS